MAIGDSREEDQLIQDRRRANEEFRNATRILNEASKKNLENSLRQQLGLTKEGVRASIEDKLLGSGMKRIVYNFVLDRMRERKLRTDLNMSKADWKAFKKEESRRKKEIALAKAAQAERKARENVLRATLGEEQAAIEIARINEEEKEKIQEEQRVLMQEDMANAEREKEAEDAAALLRAEQRQRDEAQAAADAEKINSLTEAANAIMDAFTQSDIAESFGKFANSLDSIINSTGLGDMGAGHMLVAEQLELMRAEQSGAGESPAERDKAKAEAKEASDKQIDLLQKIADNISGGGSGGGGGNGSGGGDMGGGMLAKLGAGLGALGKGIGVLLKFAGKGLLVFLKSFALGIKSFANPLVIAGLAVFTLGMIGLGAALRIAAPAFEALAPVLIKIADVIGNVLMKAIEEFAPVLIKIADVIGNVFMAAIKAIPAILGEIGNIITAVGTQISGIIDSIGNSIRKVGEGVKEVLNGVSGVIVAIGDTISGVITSVAEGIATVVNSFKGPSLDEKTAAVERLSKIDPALMASTAKGIELIGAALDSIGGGVKIPFFSKESPVAGIIELAKNSQGITDASNAIKAFVENANLFSEEIEIDDSVIEGIEKVVKALGSGNPAGLSAFDKAINSINGLDASKISLLQGIKIPEITPQTAAEYEKVFNAMQKNQPDLIDKVSSTLGRFFGSSEEESGNMKKPITQTAAASVAATKPSGIAARSASAPPVVQPSLSKGNQANQIAASPPAAAPAAAAGGGNVSISAPTTNSSQSTSSYPITNRPNNPAMDRMRNSLDF